MLTLMAACVLPGAALGQTVPAFRLGEVTLTPSETGDLLIAVPGREPISLGLRGWFGDWVYFAQSAEGLALETSTEGRAVLSGRRPPDRPEGYLSYRAEVESLPDAVRVAYTFEKHGELPLRRGVHLIAELPRPSWEGQDLWCLPTQVCPMPCVPGGNGTALAVPAGTGALLMEFGAPVQFEDEPYAGQAQGVRCFLTPSDFAAAEVVERTLTIRLAEPPALRPTSELRDDRPLRLGAVRVPPRVAACELLEASVDLAATWRNPFDPDQVTLDGHFRPVGSRREVVVPGFLTQDFRREVRDGGELLFPEGPPRWVVRFAAEQPGGYEVSVTATNGGATVQSAPQRFTVTARRERGFIRVSPNDPRRLAFPDGSPFFAIGDNWETYTTTAPGVDEYFPTMAAHGMNYNRFWMYSNGLGLEWDSQVGEYRLDNAARLDHALAAARANGIYLMLCFDTHQDFIGEEGGSRWRTNPYNVARGGPCATPNDFFTSPEAQRLYRHRLRYLVARWGWDCHVLCWEFGNEFEGWPDRNWADVRRWHAEMSRTLDRLDPFDHLISTSFWTPAGMPDIWDLRHISLVQTHHYANAQVDMARRVRELCLEKQRNYDKPHLFGEYGIYSHTTTADKDPTGLHLHEGNFAALLALCNSVPVSWWHTSYIDPLGLYYRYDGIARFVAGLDLTAGDWRMLEVSDLRYQQPPAQLDYWPVRLDTEAGWGAAAGTDFTVREDGTIAEGLSPHNLLQGRGHADMRVPPTFHVDYPTDGQFIIRVGRVSDGGLLQVWLDGRLVHTEELPCGEGLGEESVWQEAWTLWETVYNRDIAVPVPAGAHTIRVDNDGADWINVPYYELADYASNRLPQLDVWGLARPDEAILWAKNQRYTWFRVAAGEEIPPVEPVAFEVLGLRDGTYEVESWDTVAGKVVDREEATCAASRLALRLPAVSSDVALKLRRR